MAVRSRPARSAPVGDDRGGAVAEKAGGDEIGDRLVLALNGQRAQLHREQRRHVIGKRAQVVVHARHAGGAGHTAQAEQRDPFDVGPQPDPRRQPRLQRRYGQPGDRRREHDVDLRRLDLGLVQRRQQRLLTQLERDLEIGVVRLGETVQLAVSRQPQRGMAVLNPAGAREPLKVWTGDVGQRSDDLILGIAVAVGTSPQPLAMDGSFSRRSPV